MSIRNGVQLITYADRLGDGNIESLTSILQGPLGGLFTGVHILPFYYPYDGEDAGFDPIDHTLSMSAWAIGTTSKSLVNR